MNFLDGFGLVWPLKIKIKSNLGTPAPTPGSYALCELNLFDANLRICLKQIRKLNNICRSCGRKV